MSARALLLAALPLALAACATTSGGSTARAPAPAPSPSASEPAVVIERGGVPAPHAGAHTPKVSPYAPAQEDPSKRGDYVAGGLFRPGVPDTVPEHIPDVDAIPEPEVRAEPLARTGNRDYAVLGKRYRVLDTAANYVEQGQASYYGNKFHGRRTSSGEVYDMYAFTAAHKTLPLPSFARVTNLDNGKSVVVRINDRGPFHPGRIIDLSYAAAVKLGYREKGTARVEVRALHPGEDPGTGTLLADNPPSALDRLVGELPASAASAGLAPAATKPAAPVQLAQVGPATPAQADAGYRFDMRQDGRVMTADEFDAWMKARQVRVATGKPGKPDAAAGKATTPAPDAAAMPAPPPAAVAADKQAGEHVTLQVASFANQRNAEQALALLRGAEIGAQLHDTDVNGRKVWRLRIGPVAAAMEAELAARVEGLGFGRPQRVRD